MKVVGVGISYILSYKIKKYKMQGEVETTETPVRYHTSFGNWLTNYFLAPFSWSRWTDITTFAFGGAYLLQGKVNSRTNAKKFNICPYKIRL